MDSNEAPRQSGTTDQAVLPHDSRWLRWGICVLLLGATTIDYITRCAADFLGPSLSLHLGRGDFGHGEMVVWFLTGYIGGFVFFGWLIDRVGVKSVYLFAVALWALSQILSSVTASLFGFAVALLILGFGLGGNTPAILRAVADWFPQVQRSLANGIAFAGAGIGILLSSLALPGFVQGSGRTTTFLLIAALSLGWIALWRLIYRDPPAKDAAPPEQGHAAIGWRRLLRTKECWAYGFATLLVDSVWWFIMYWLPAHFANLFDLTLKEMVPPLVTIYLMSAAGGILGGWFSYRLTKLGVSINAARKLTMMLCAGGVLPIALSGAAPNMWLVVGAAGLACAAHQAFVANLHSFPSDVFPVERVGSVAGIGGAIGAAGGLTLSWVTGHVVTATGNYTPMLMAAPLAYVGAVAIIQWLSPRLEPVKLA